jgi:hypothetical protein
VLELVVERALNGIRSVSAQKMQQLHSRPEGVWFPLVTDTDWIRYPEPDDPL